MIKCATSNDRSFFDSHNFSKTIFFPFPLKTFVKLSSFRAIKDRDWPSILSAQCFDWFFQNFAIIINLHNISDNKKKRSYVDFYVKKLDVYCVLLLSVLLKTKTKATTKNSIECRNNEPVSPTHCSSFKKAVVRLLVLEFSSFAFGFSFFFRRVISCHFFCLEFKVGIIKFMSGYWRRYMEWQRYHKLNYGNFYGVLMDF